MTAKQIKEIIKVSTYRDKHGNVHKYVGDIFSYHNAHLMALMINEQQEVTKCKQQQ